MGTWLVKGSASVCSVNVITVWSLNLVIFISVQEDESATKRWWVSFDPNNGIQVTPLMFACYFMSHWSPRTGNKSQTEPGKDLISQSFKLQSIPQLKREGEVSAWQIWSVSFSRHTWTHSYTLVRTDRRCCKLRWQRRCWAVTSDFNSASLSLVSPSGLFIFSFLVLISFCQLLVFISVLLCLFFCPPSVHSSSNCII